MLKSNDGSPDEQKFESEKAAKTRELDLREREVAAKEREATAARWSTPIVLGLVAAFLGFLANLVVTALNNYNTLQVERQRSQSTLLLEAIKTGGGTDAVCKNLVFFVELGLVDDTNKTIRTQCGGAPKGVPSLPAAPSGTTFGLPGFGVQPFGKGSFGALTGYVYDADTNLPVAGAKVTVSENTAPVIKGLKGIEERGTALTDSMGFFPILPGEFVLPGSELDVTVEKTGYQTANVKLKVDGLLTVGLHREK